MLLPKRSQAKRSRGAAARVALVAASILIATTTSMAAKVIKRDASERIDERIHANAPGQSAPTVNAAEAAQAQSGASPTAIITSPNRPPQPAAKAAVDPNQPDPPSERAAAAADRAKRALADEDFEDYATETPPPGAGQPVPSSLGKKSAASAAKPSPKCLAGC